MEHADSNWKQLEAYSNAFGRVIVAKCVDAAGKINAGRSLQYACADRAPYLPEPSPAPPVSAGFASAGTARECRHVWAPEACRELGKRRRPEVALRRWRQVVAVCFSGQTESFSALHTFHLSALAPAASASALQSRQSQLARLAAMARALIFAGILALAVAAAGERLSRPGQSGQSCSRCCCGAGWRAASGPLDAPTPQTSPWAPTSLKRPGAAGGSITASRAQTSATAARRPSSSFPRSFHPRCLPTPPGRELKQAEMAEMEEMPMVAAPAAEMVPAEAEQEGMGRRRLRQARGTGGCDFLPTCALAWACGQLRAAGVSCRQSHWPHSSSHPPQAALEEFLAPLAELPTLGRRLLQV